MSPAPRRGRRVGIVLGRAHARAALVEAGGRRGPRVLAAAEAPVDPAAWTGEPGALADALAALARALPSGARRADRPVALALPDPVAGEDRLVFRALPDDPAELAQLARFRAARDRRRDPDEFACAAQVVGPVADGEEEGVEVIVRLAPRAVVDAALDAAWRAGFVPARVDTFAGFAVDEAARRIAAPAGGWFRSGDGARSLMCWSRGDGRHESHLHAEWDASAGDAAVARAVRIATSFALRRGLDRLPLALDPPEPARAAGAEAARAGAVVEPIPAPRALDPAPCVALA